ncbi:hypothetical protein BDV26DRAFT_279319 [Aspergillus bertholletiae]|uniref:Nucleoside phosphorylase domain-containing protein n=1 Tax=Aspergillus bertholletiae TaxID=1226010 RepID=A0A5N7BG03_9EURO|nr:hypothetical protein BDV26DRAFT_279319 [Aspergillus bertholletiae]
MFAELKAFIKRNWKICALPLEMTAANVMLEKVHPSLPQPVSDHNVYILGSVSGRNVVVAALPGTISASAVASHMASTFPSIQFALMVGIGGGVPSQNADIRLGDVVVSKPTATSSGVIQYDYSKTLRDGRFQHTGSLNKPHPALLRAMSHLESDYRIGKRPVSKILLDVLHKYEVIREKFSRPKDDWLFRPTYSHENSEHSCSACNQTQLVNRPKRITDDPYFHYSLIASGDQVMKDAKTRDSIAQDWDILCFAIEATGFMDELQPLVIRGICDYCDSYKNKLWQGYAALAAAAYAKALLKNPQFVGREEEITRTEELIMQQNGPGKVAICGLGGCLIFWVTCTSYESVEQAYISIASKLGMTDIKPAEIKEKVKAYLSQKSAGKWLLVFDNADNLEMWSKDNTNKSALTAFLPQGEQGHILFTTRSKKVAVKLPSIEASVKILQNSLVEKSLPNNHDTTITLLEQLAFLPLAITQAAAYINENYISVSRYLELLKDQEPNVIELLSEDFYNERRYKDTQNPVALTWFSSFQQIQQSNILAADYLSFMACINPRNIPHFLLPQPNSIKKKIDAIGLLKAFSFVSEEVHLATRNWMRKNQRFSLQILKTADHLSKVWREYLPHAFSLIAEADFQKKKEHYIDFIAKVGRCLYSEGRWKEAEELGIQVMQLQKQVLGPEHPDTLASMGNLALTYTDQGRWKEAEELQVQVMQLRKQVLGPEHPDTLAIMGNLALTYRGPEHPDNLISMANPASTYYTITTGSQYMSDQVFTMEQKTDFSTQSSALSETEDRQTVYSENFSLKGSTKEAYVDELVRELLRAIPPFPIDPLSRRRVVEAMPDCLRAFALRLSSADSSEQVHRDVSAFVRKYKQ